MTFYFSNHPTVLIIVPLFLRVRSIGSGYSMQTPPVCLLELERPHPEPCELVTYERIKGYSKAGEGGSLRRV